MSSEANRRKVRELLRRSENRVCADCGAGKPTWASINIGVFVCLNCAGIHRDLGVHVSKVRSVELDTWQDEWIATMSNMGNTKANSLWEASLNQSLKPNERDSQALSRKLRNFIRDKYEGRRFFGNSSNFNKTSEGRPVLSSSQSFDFATLQKQRRERRDQRRLQRGKMGNSLESTTMDRPRSSSAVSEIDFLGLSLQDTSVKGGENIGLGASPSRSCVPEKGLEAKSEFHFLEQISGTSKEKTSSNSYDEKAKQIMALLSSPGKSAIEIGLKKDVRTSPAIEMPKLVSKDEDPFAVLLQ